MKINEIVDGDVVDIGTGFGGLKKQNPETKGDERFASRGKVASDGAVSAYHEVRLPKTTVRQLRVMIAGRIFRARDNIAGAFDKFSAWNATPYTGVSFSGFVVDNMVDPTEIRISFEVSPLQGNLDKTAVKAVIKVLKRMISEITNKAVEDFRG